MVRKVGNRNHIVNAIAIVTCFAIGVFIYSCAGRIETGEMDAAEDYPMSRVDETTESQTSRAFISMGEKESEMY
ncbi:MAG: hypothetical protein IKC98_03385, partial [Firmicutes bacterium]|nr:hypothetical protein [Bacillota bacterium]